MNNSQPVPARTPEGLTAEQVRDIRARYPIHHTSDGQVSIPMTTAERNALCDEADRLRAALTQRTEERDEAQRLLTNQAKDCNEALRLLAQAREQRDAVLRDVAKLPSPIAVNFHSQPFCEWCAWVGESMQEGWSFSAITHPNNGCLYVRALAASGRGSAPQGDT